MAHILQIVDGDGNVLATLTSGAWALFDYTPQTPGERTTDIATQEDGAERPKAAYSNVREEAVFHVTVANADILRATLSAVQALFAQARRFQERRVGVQIYLLWQPSGSGAAWRSEVLGGSYQVGADFYGYEWVNMDVEVTLRWTRRFYWEGPEYAVPLTNGNGTDSTTGLNVYNANDGTGASPNKIHYYALITGTYIVGELPAATRIEVKNKDATRSGAQLWMAQNIDATPSDWTGMFEAESATGGTGAADANCAGTGGNTRKDVTVTTTEAALLTWALTADQVAQADSNYFKVLLRFSPTANTANINSVKYRLQIHTGSGVLWEGPQVRPDTSRSYIIVELGNMRLPPRRVDDTYMLLDFRLLGQSVTGGSVTLSIDYVAILALNGWRVLKTVAGNAVGLNETWVDDSLRRTAHVLALGPGGQFYGRPNVVTEGQPIMLMPGVDQRLHFLVHSSTAYTAPHNWLHQVKIYYRPRVLVV